MYKYTCIMTLYCVIHVLCVVLSDCGLSCVVGVGFPGNPQSFTSLPTASLPKGTCIYIYVCVCV